MTAATLKARWTAFATSARGRRVLRLARWLFAAGILAYLAYDLTRIGWHEIGAGLPTNPLFYLLFLLLYFSIPIAEVFLYRITWHFDGWRSFPAFVKKRIYNKDVLGYSGEVFFYTWARKNIDLSDLDVLKTIRDQNIISSVASTVIAVLMVVFFLYSGKISVAELMGQHYVSYLIGGTVVLLVLTALGIRWRKYLFSMTLKTTLLVLGVQCLRLIVGQGVQIAQWAVAMPEVPLRVWFTYAAVSIIVSRIPIIPNRDLIFLGAGVSLAGLVQISSAGVAGMLVMITVLGKVLNVVFFAGLSLLGRSSGPAPPPVEKPPRVAEPEEVV